MALSTDRHSVSVCWRHDHDVGPHPHFVEGVKLAPDSECNYPPPPNGHGSLTNACRLQLDFPNRFHVQTIDGVVGGKVVPGKFGRAELMSNPEVSPLAFKTARRPGFRRHLKIRIPGLYVLSLHSSTRQGTHVWFCSASIPSPGLRDPKAAGNHVRSTS